MTLYNSKQEEYQDRVVRSDGCWRWLGGFSNKYPQFSSGGTVHRWALEQKLGRALRAKMMACHTCDNKWCCNPNHLYEGTGRDNILDVFERGTTKTTRTLRRIERGVIYSLRSPDGTEYIDIRDFPEFCRRHGLTQGNARKVAIGEQNYHKGWAKI
jgi:hypothetical protein